MSRDKQIEEMAIEFSKVNCKPKGCGYCYLEYGTLENSCEEYLFYKKTVTALYNAGYRKASEVARETVEAIKAEVSKKEQYISDLYGYGGYMIATTDLEDIIRRYMFDTYEEAELKKKYTKEIMEEE